MILEDFFEIYLRIFVLCFRSFIYNFKINVQFKIILKNCFLKNCVEILKKEKFLDFEFNSKMFGKYKSFSQHILIPFTSRRDSLKFRENHEGLN